MKWTEMRERCPWLPESGNDYHQHENGGGWVHNTAEVDKTAHIGDGTVIGVNALIGEGAEISINKGGK